MTTQPNEIGSTRTSSAEKEFLCKQSKQYFCPTCHIPHQMLLPRDPNSIIGTGFALKNSKLLLSGTRLVLPTGSSSKRRTTLKTQKSASNGVESKRKREKKPRRYMFKHLKSKNVHNLMRFAVVVTGSMLIRGLIDTVLKFLYGALSINNSSF